MACFCRESHLLRLVSALQYVGRMKTSHAGKVHRMSDCGAGGFREADHVLRHGRAVSVDRQRRLSQLRCVIWLVTQGRLGHRPAVSASISSKVLSESA